MTVDDYQKVEMILNDFRVFFIENSLFLSDENVEKIRKIHFRLKDIHEIARTSYASGKLDTDLRGYMPRMPYLSDLRSYIDATEEEWNDFDYADIMDIMINDTHNQVKELKYLYQSVAELKN